MPAEQQQETITAVSQSEKYKEKETIGQIDTPY
jgi:hypothetical protein